MAGLQATSARVASLRAVPGVLKEHGCLTPALVHQACVRLGYAVHLSAFYQLLPDLAVAGLIPASAIRVPASRMARLANLPIDDEGFVVKSAAGTESFPAGEPV